MTRKKNTASHSILRILRPIFLIIAAITAGIWVFHQKAPQADGNTYMSSEVQLTADKAIALLRAPTEESQLFIRNVFELARRGTIPEKILLSAFNYAMTKNEYRHKYFEQGIITMAGKLGYDIPYLIRNMQED